MAGARGGGERDIDRPLPFATIDDETETGTDTHGYAYGCAVAKNK